MNSTQFVGSGFYIDPSLELIWIPLAIQLIATLIGAFVGFSFVMLWDRKKKRDDMEQTKVSMLDAIIVELKTVQTEILTPSIPKIEWMSMQKYFSGKRTSVPTTAFQSAVNSGNFSLLSSLLQKE